jgi:phosphoglycolate phosphatase
LTSLVTQDLEALGVFHLISMVFGSDVTAYTKPDPKSLDVVVAWLCDRGYCISRTLYVGDSVNDLMVARGRGLPFVAVLTGRTSVEAFRMAGWKGPIVRSLEELVQAR